MRARAWWLPALMLALWGLAAGATPPNLILEARYEEPTDRYDHGILGDGIEWGALRLVVDQCLDCETRQVREYLIRLPEIRVFEDVAPRLVDLDQDGFPYVMVVESDASQGARLALYSEAGLVAATPFIGQRNRWLAPLGAADLDGDGTMEVAYVDRPHLAKTLRIWRWTGAALEELAAFPGVTNHRIGERDIAGGIRDCGDQPEMVLARADWSRLVGLRFDGKDFAQRDLGPHRDRGSFAQAMQC